ncbi:MAG: hypothetical protein QME81_09855 [bacterium]|nr:hypothetical protein [bacterium]
MMRRILIATLICLFIFPGGGGADSGDILWNYGLPTGGSYNSYPYDVIVIKEGLPGAGNLLITEMHNRRRVIEVTPDYVNGGGAEKVVYDNSVKMTRSERLSNGNTLIVEPHEGHGRIWEVNASGSKVRKWYDADAEGKGSDGALDGDIIKDGPYAGHLLVTMRYSNEVFIIDKDNPTNRLWECSTGSNPVSADALPNGNIVIAERNTKKVKEIRLDGTVVWEITGLDAPYDAELLPNGHVAIIESGGYYSSQGRLVEFKFDKDGNPVKVGELITGLNYPHGLDFVIRDDGRIDFVIADTCNNRIFLAEGWSSTTPPGPPSPPIPLTIISIANQGGVRRTVMLEVTIDSTTGLPLPNTMNWREMKGVPAKFR